MYIMQTNKWIFVFVPMDLHLTVLLHLISLLMTVIDLGVSQAEILFTINYY